MPLLEPNHRLQIIYLHPHFVSDGGAGRMVLETARLLAECGHQVHVVCIRADSGIVGQVGDNVQFHQIGGPLSSSIWFWIRFNRSCRLVLKVIDAIASNADGMKTILFPQVFPANWWGAFVVKRSPQFANVWYCQEPSAFIHSRAWKRSLPWPKNWIAISISPVMAWLDRRFCGRFSRVLVNSDFSRRSIIEVYGFSDQACRTVYLGVDHQRFKPDTSFKRKPWVCVIAKITRFKNVDVIVNAIAELVRRGLTDVHLHVVGVGDALEECQQTAEAACITDHVTFHGRLGDDRVVELLQQSRVFCLASADEPFGLVVVEALACGTPVVAMNSGGPAEILKDLSCGKLCESVNAIHIADALEHFLTMNDDSFAAASSEATRRASEFRWENAAQEIEGELLRSASSCQGSNPLDVAQ
jgi:glycosyltransferase involved in cell wall biosynthesis